MPSLDLENRKHRRTVLFGIGLQLRRIYDIAEREPVPERIARLLDKLDYSDSATASPHKRRDCS